MGSNTSLILNQWLALRFVGSGSPTATLYLYPDMNLKKSGKFCSQNREPNNSLGDSFVNDRRTLDLFIKCHKLSHLDNSNLSLPIQARASRLYGSVGTNLRIPIGTYKKRLPANDHSAIMDTAGRNLL